MLWRAPEPEHRDRVMGEAEAFQITSMLRVGGGRRHRARGARAGRARPGRREDRHDQQRGRHLVRRLHADARRRRSGSATTRPARSRPTPRAGVSPRRRGPTSTATAGRRRRRTSRWEPPLGLVSRTIDRRAPATSPTSGVRRRSASGSSRAPSRCGSAPGTMRPLMHELEKFGREVGEALKDLLGL